MSILRVALAQVAWSGDRESMLDRLQRAVREAASQGAQLVAFPELCTTPYFCDEPDRQVDDAFEPIPDGPTTRRMSALAKEVGAVLVVPLAEHDDQGRRYNSAVIVDANGHPVGTHRKRYLPHGPGSWERSYFRPGGSGPAVVTTSVGRIGVAICWERNFPDTWQRLLRDRAQLTLVPTASGLSSTDQAWTLIQPAAAYLNAMFVATINRVSETEPARPTYSGGSYVANPQGQIVGPIGPKHTAIIIRQIDLEDTTRAAKARGLTNAAHVS